MMHDSLRVLDAPPTAERAQEKAWMIDIFSAVWTDVRLGADHRFRFLGCTFHLFYHFFQITDQPRYLIFRKHRQGTRVAGTVVTTNDLTSIV